MTARERVVDLFEQAHGSVPELVVRAPGRVNLIGDHTDYNDGFVLPMAIDLDLVIAARRRDDGVVSAVSEAESERAHVDLAAPGPVGAWSDYLSGVASVLDASLGWSGAIASDIPVGAGLSSSAALELAIARVFVELAGSAWDPTAMAAAGNRVENEWIGMQSGIMDQLIVADGRSSHALLIDCRDLERRPIPIPDDVAVVLLDTGTRRTLAGSEYNDRRADCERAAAWVGVPTLRDATLVDIERLSGDERRRARHVVTENARTVAAADALAAGDLQTLGEVMKESHGSLRDDFDVSSEALDAMALIAQDAPGCIGARQTGGGFAGFCVGVVEADVFAAFGEHVTSSYHAATGLDGSVAVVQAVDGASSEWVT